MKVFNTKQFEYDEVKNILFVDFETLTGKKYCMNQAMAECAWNKNQEGRPCLYLISELTGKILEFTVVNQFDRVEDFNHIIAKPEAPFDSKLNTLVVRISTKP